MLEQSCEDPNNTQVGDTANRLLKCYFMNEGSFPLCHQSNSRPWSILEVEPLLQGGWEFRFSTAEALANTALSVKGCWERLQQLRSSLSGVQPCLAAVCLHVQLSHSTQAAPTATCPAPWVMWWPVGTFHRATPCRAAYQLSSVTPTTL